MKSRWSGIEDRRCRNIRGHGGRYRQGIRRYYPALKKPGHLERCHRGPTRLSATSSNTLRWAQARTSATCSAFSARRSSCVPENGKSAIHALYAVHRADQLDLRLFDLFHHAVCRRCLDKCVAISNGWFVEPILTQTLIIHVIRTARKPFIESWASPPLIISTIIICAIAIALPSSVLTPMAMITATETMRPPRGTLR